jgi:DNA-directed RNA polymerase subunit RPC12/RpoP
MVYESEQSRYMPAAVCRRGHTITSDTTLSGDIATKCPDCGARVLISTQRIVDALITEGVKRSVGLLGIRPG